MCTKISPETVSERILEIGLSLPQLWSKVKCIVFLRQCIIHLIPGFILCC